MGELEMKAASVEMAGNVDINKFFTMAKEKENAISEAKRIQK